MQNITEKELLESIYSVLKEALIIDIIDKNRDKLGNITEDNIDDYAQILTEEYNSFLNHISADEKVEKSVPKYDLLTWLDYWFGVKGKSSSLIANGVFQDESKKYLEYLNRYRKEKNSFLDTVKSHAQEVASDNKLLEAFINIKPEDKSLFIESAKNDKLKSKLVFATTQKIKDGVDCKSQDCLILGSPVRNIEQLSGRIVRTDEGKKIPIIIDIIDIDEQQVRLSAKNRIKFYQSKDWVIQYLRFTNEMKLEVISEEQAKKILKGE